MDAGCATSATGEVATRFPRRMPLTAPCSEELTGRTLGRVLISEDNLGIERIYRHLLPRHGFEVITTPDGDGQMTVELCRAHLPDLVITDVNKPGMNGHEVCRALRSDARTAHIPLLFVTAMDEWLERRRGHTEYAADYIVKPFPLEGLLYRMASLMDLSYEAQEELVARAMQLPGFEHFHPVTGIPGPHALAHAIGHLTCTLSWAALTFDIAGFDQLLRVYGRHLADDLLLRLSIDLRMALQRRGSSNVVIAHPGYDWRIALVGPARALQGVAEEVRPRFADELRRRLAAADASRGPLPGLTGGHLAAPPPPTLAVRHLDARTGMLADLRSFWQTLDSAALV